MKKSILILFLVACATIVSQAQGPITKGDKAFEALAFEKAIQHYKKAEEGGMGNAHVHARLGESFRLVNRPAEAAAEFERLMSYKHDPIYDLRYGQVLMALGNYEAAEPLLESYQQKNPREERVNNLLVACRKIGQLETDAGRFKLVHTNINSSASDFGPVLHDGQLYFSSARKASAFRFSWDGTDFLDLFSAKYKGSPRLGKPEALATRLNSRFHEAIPAFSKDGQRMLFTRNNFHRGKLGFAKDQTIKLKIYEAKLKGKRWKVKGEFPYNSDEYSVGHPTFSTSGDTVYFASDMPGGQGGVDIYYSVANGENWDKPVNLGPTINTEGDEMFPWKGDGKQLVFASNGHKGLGGLDLFEVQLDGKSEVENLGAPINSVADDFQLVMDEAKGIGFFTSNREGGLGADDIYSFKIQEMVVGNVVAEHTGEPLEDVTVSVIGTRHEIGRQLTDGKGDFHQGIAKGAYFLTFTKDGYETHSQKIMVKAGEKPDPLFVQLKPNKDCEDAFVKLEGKTLKGGNVKPGTRIVVKMDDVVVESDENGEFEMPLAKGLDYTVAIDEPGLSEPVVKSLSVPLENPDPVYPVELDFDLKDTSQPFFIIYYDLDKSKIRKYDARPELDRVAAFMQRRQDVKVELSSHTDARASKYYNIALSQRRAEEAFAYLVSKGIEKDRLQFKWFGEEKPVNKCVDGTACSEEEHQLNRRTEFRLVD